MLVLERLQRRLLAGNLRCKDLLDRGLAGKTPPSPLCYSALDLNS